MKSQITLVLAGLTSVAMFPSAAQAFSFTTNNFDGTNRPDAKGDIFLESVTLQGTGEVVTDFSFVYDARIVSNDKHTGGNTGAASADKGDKATTGVKVEDATEESIVTNLATSNLNNIIDTEDGGSFQIDLFFNKAIDNLLVWERGRNSKLAVQALDANGNLVGNRLVLDSRNFDYAGFDIDTLEIGGAQQVGSRGVSILNDLGVSTSVNSLRFSSEKGFNGPDWKFVGVDAARNEEPESVPEPATLFGLGLLSALALVTRRRVAQ